MIARQQRLGVAELVVGEVVRVEREREQRQEAGDQARGLVGEPDVARRLSIALASAGHGIRWLGAHRLYGPREVACAGGSRPPSASCSSRARSSASSCATRRRTCCARTAWSPSIRRGCPTARSRACRRPSATPSPRARRGGWCARCAGNVGEPRVVVIFHPLQYQLGRALTAAAPGCELWYWRWDRFENAYDAHRAPARAPRRAARAGRRSGRRWSSRSPTSSRASRARPAASPTLVAARRRRLPRAPTRGDVVAISLGHLGWRTDWSLLRAVSRAPRRPARAAARRRLARGRVQGRRRLRLVPFGPEPRLARAAGRRGARPPDPVQPTSASCPSRSSRSTTPACPTASSSTRGSGAGRSRRGLAGVRTWADAVTFADGARGVRRGAARTTPGAARRPTRSCASGRCAQTARAQDEPLWQRLERRGIARRHAGARRGPTGSRVGG